jgi:hypothetical protein
LIPDQSRSFPGLGTIVLWWNTVKKNIFHGFLSYVPKIWTAAKIERRPGQTKAGRGKTGRKKDKETRLYGGLYGKSNTIVQAK